MPAESNKRKSNCYFKDDTKTVIKKVPDDEQKAYFTVCMTAISVAGVRISALGGDHMIPVTRDEILFRFAWILAVL